MDWQSMRLDQSVETIASELNTYREEIEAVRTNTPTTGD